jgi:hypothetical protein
MPIEFNVTQNTKPQIKDKTNGEPYIDFIHRDITVDPSQAPKGINYYLVTQETSMRIDLISKKMYGNMDMIEKILKFNNISNPLSIDDGDLLVIYDPISLNKNFRNINNQQAKINDIRKQYLAPEKDSRVDPKLKEFDKRNKKPGEKSAQENALPPNYADFGDKEIQLRNGKLYFGPNVTKSKEACEEPISKSEFLARLVKNRLNNNK